MARPGWFDGKAYRAILVVGLGAGCNTFEPPNEQGARLVIPTDTRPAEQPDQPLPPVTGGTLLVTQSGTLAVTAVPELDAVMGVSLSDSRVLWSIPLEPSEVPGRLVEDETGVVHVVLRRAGAVASIDPGQGALLRTRAVCAEPRGIAVTAPGELTVACASGQLVTLPAADGEPTRVLELPLDLRDVVVRGDELVVSRFKSVELLHLSRDGAVTGTTQPRSVLGARHLPIEDEPEVLRTVHEPFAPRIAWKTLVAPDGSVVTLHQRALEAEVVLSEPSTSGNAYGGPSGGPCNTIVQNAVTVVRPDGTTTDVTFAGAPLAVDAALLPEGRLVVAHAGTADPGAPRPFVVMEPSSGAPVSGAGPALGSNLSLLQLPSTSSGAPSDGESPAPDPGCTVGRTFLATVQPAVAVASNPKAPTQVVVQLRDPAALLVVDDLNGFDGASRTIPLGNGGPRDTGFDLVHRDSGAGIACASCHPEGGEDGHVWQFSGIGPRRTQPLNAAIEHTAPYHWDGDLEGLGAIMSAVFVGRMGGVHQSAERLASLESWLFALPAPAPVRPADDAAVQRGKALFESAETGCATCHSGKWLTNNQSVAVGTGKALQVPSLVGIAHRAPFLHDGCARTLADRFDPDCGGDAHGDTSALSPEQLGDLVAYLESL